MKKNKIICMLLVLALLYGCCTKKKIETTPTPISTPEVTPTAHTTIYFDDIDLDHLEEVLPNSLYYACEFDEEIVYKIYNLRKNFDSETNELEPYIAQGLHQFDETIYINAYKNDLTENKIWFTATENLTNTHATQMLYYEDADYFIGGADMEFLTEEHLYGLMLPEGFESAWDSGLNPLIEEIERNIISGDYEEEPYIYKCKRME